ncbi:MAG: alpha/beta fold hydrolase [Candidatus Binatia bacterium]
MNDAIGGGWGKRYPPAQAKFKSTLLLVHGLWSGAWCWHSWATHFCNLGWDSVAIDLRRRSPQNVTGGPQRVSFDDCVQDLREIIRSFSTPPVLLAMDLGALMALKALEESEASSIILVSPSPPANLDTAKSRRLRLLWLKYRLLILLKRPFRIDEKDFRANFLAPLPANLQTTISQQTVPEPSALVREFFAPSVSLKPGPLPYPLLVVGGSDDAITPPATSNAIAHHLGGEFRAYRGQGHWLIEHDGENIVRDIHRWIIRKLGERILLANFS